MRTIAALFAVASLAACNGAAREQPIPFNHQIHLTKGGLQCETCHEHASDRAHAGLPRLDVCMDCHRTTAPSNPAGAAHVQTMRRLAKEGADVIWVRVYELPAHVYFSHQRHAEVAGLECKLCHGDVAELTTPPSRPIARTLKMDTCLACHESKGVTTDCTACHR